jgi:hypothetical protein
LKYLSCSKPGWLKPPDPKEIQTKKNGKQTSKKHFSLSSHPSVARIYLPTNCLKHPTPHVASTWLTNYIPPPTEETTKTTKQFNHQSPCTQANREQEVNRE